MARDMLMKGPQQFIHQTEFMIVASVEFLGRTERYDGMAYDHDASPSDLPNDSSRTNEFSDGCVCPTANDRVTSRQLQTTLEKRFKRSYKHSFL
jgi:hypothetical protein